MTIRCWENGGRRASRIVICTVRTASVGRRTRALQNLATAAFRGLGENAADAIYAQLEGPLRTSSAVISPWCHSCWRSFDYKRSPRTVVTGAPQRQL
jgi:hypothetical protein